MSTNIPNTTADWTKKCIVCGQTPVLGELEMCAACTFGEAEAQEELRAE